MMVEERSGINAAVSVIFSTDPWNVIANTEETNEVRLGEFKSCNWLLCPDQVFIKENDNNKKEGREKIPTLNSIPEAAPS